MLVTERDGAFLKGRITSPLALNPLHGLRQDDVIVFRADHIVKIKDTRRMWSAVEEADRGSFVDEYRSWISKTAWMSLLTGFSHDAKIPALEDLDEWEAMNAEQVESPHGRDDATVD